MGLMVLCLGLLASTPPARPGGPGESVIVFQNGLRGGWQDFGWAPRDVLPGQPARVDFSNHGGWIVGGPDTQGSFEALVIWMRAPAGHGTFLAVRLAGKGVGLPTVIATPEYSRIVRGTWREIRIPYAQLNPNKVSFDTITLSAVRLVPTGWVYIENIEFVQDGGTTPLPPSVVTPEPEAGENDTHTDTGPLAGEEFGHSNIIGLALHAGFGVPAGGGSAMFTAGLSARLSFADAHLGLGLRAAVSYHSLATQAADATGGSLIDVRSSVIMLPVLGVLTLRLPLGDFAAYSHVGCGGAWLWASGEALGKQQSANDTSWAVHGALGVEMALGPGWLGAEVGYLILPSLQLDDVFQQYQGDGLTVSFHFRLGM